MVKNKKLSKRKYGTDIFSQSLPLTGNETGGLHKEFQDAFQKGYLYNAGGQLNQGFELPNKQFGERDTNRPRFYNAKCKNNNVSGSSFGISLKKSSKKCTIKHRTAETKRKCKKCHLKRSKTKSKVSKKNYGSHCKSKSRGTSKYMKKKNSKRFGKSSRSKVLTKRRFGAIPANFDSINGTNTFATGMKELHTVLEPKHERDLYKSFAPNCNDNYPVYCMGHNHSSGYIHPSHNDAYHYNTNPNSIL